MTRFVGTEGEKIKLGDEEFTIKALTAKDIEIFTDMQKGDDKKAMIELVTKSLQNSDETITKEDVEQMPLGMFTKVSEVVFRLNELS